MGHRSKALRVNVGGSVERPQYKVEYRRWQLASSEECDKYNEARRLRNQPTRPPAPKLLRIYGETF